MGESVNALFGHITPQQWACIDLAREHAFRERVEILERMKRFESVGSASAIAAAFARARGQ